MTTPPLFGLILAGGASTRMQQDKAALSYHGKSQLAWAFALLSGRCAATFVSVRPEQRPDPVRAAFPQIVDREPGAGPLAGIDAALSEHPHAAWLILACDLPFLTEPTLDRLIARRDPQRMATAYRSAHDGLPEPLCAIWEPAARDVVRACLEQGKHCPRKLLINSDTLLLDPLDAHALDNVNTREDFTAALAALGGAAVQNESGALARKIHVQYYAILREQAGCSEEMIDTTAATPAQLYEELRGRHAFKLSAAQLKVALNSAFADWLTPLKQGDTVVFIPPVAGG